MPRGVRWEIQDVTGADANWRLDQMSILNGFAVCVWEFNRERLMDGWVNGNGSACNPKTHGNGDKNVRLSEVKEGSLTCIQQYVIWMWCQDWGRNWSYSISRNHLRRLERMQYNPHYSSHVSVCIWASFSLSDGWDILKKQSDGTSRADMFFIDLRSEFLKPLMEPLKQQVYLTGVWRDKLTDSPVNIKCGRSYSMPVCKCVHVWLRIVSTCW